MAAGSTRREVNSKHVGVGVCVAGRSIKKKKGDSPENGRGAVVLKKG